MKNHVQIRGLAFLIVSLALCSAMGLTQNIVGADSAFQSSASQSPAVCGSTEIAAKPTRPNVTYSTDTTQCGVVEADFGSTSQWPGAQTRQNLLSSSIRLGITNRMDFRWGADNFVSTQSPTGTTQGTGDQWFGVRYRFHQQARDIPSLAFSYAVKLPTASPAKNLGTGYVDHAFTLLAGKDVQKYHFDFNLVRTLVGSPAGFENSTLATLACWRPLTRRLSVVGEGHGGTQPGQSAQAAILGGAAYAANPRLVFDGAFERPMIGAASGKRLLIGATYAIGSMYAWFKPRPAVRE